MKETKWKEDFYRALENADEKYLRECEEFLKTSRKRNRQRKVFLAAVSAAAVVFLLFLGGKYFRSAEEAETEQGSIWAVKAERPAVMETSDRGESLEILTPEDFQGGSFTAEGSGATLSLREVCRYTDRTEIYFSFAPSEPFPAESLESFLWEMQDEMIFYDREGNQKEEAFEFHFVRSEDISQGVELCFTVLSGEEIGGVEYTLKSIGIFDKDKAVYEGSGWKIGKVTFPEKRIQEESLEIRHTLSYGNITIFLESLSYSRESGILQYRFTEGDGYEMARQGFHLTLKMSGMDGPCFPGYGFGSDEKNEFSYPFAAGYGVPEEIWITEGGSRKTLARFSLEEMRQME